MGVKVRDEETLPPLPPHAPKGFAGGIEPVDEDEEANEIQRTKKKDAIFGISTMLVPVSVCVCLKYLSGRYLRAYFEELHCWSLYFSFLVIDYFKK